MKKPIFLLLSLCGVNSFALNMAYVEVNNHSLSNAGCFINKQTQKPYFDMVSIFAANIDAKDKKNQDPNQPTLAFNSQVTATLNSGQVQQLQKQGIKIGRLKTRKYMQEMGIEAIYPKPNLSKPAKGHRIYPYLLRNAVISRANQAWSTDITYTS